MRQSRYLLKLLQTGIMTIFLLFFWSCTFSTLTPEVTPSASSQDGLIYYSQRQGVKSNSTSEFGGLYFSDLTGNEKYLTESSSISEFDPFSWSPVTEQLIYTERLGDPYDETNMELHLWTYPSEKLRLTDNNYIDMDGQWSPDGTKIAFISDFGENWLYVMNPDGSNIEPILDEQLASQFGFEYAWSPDSKKIAIATIDPNDIDINLSPDNIRIIEIDSSSVSSALEGRTRVDFDWSYDSNYLVYLSDEVALGSLTNGYQGLYILDTDTNKEEQLISFELIGTPKWSPVEDVIAFSAVATQEELAIGQFNLYLINSDGTGLRQLTEDGSYRVWSWSPDGTKLALMSINGQPSDFEIYVFDIKSETLTQITDNDVLDAYPIWMVLPK